MGMGTGEDKTKGSRNEIHETHSRIQFITPQKLRYFRRI